jgi:hypothetical protein
MMPFPLKCSKKNRQKNMLAKSLIMVAPRNVWAYISFLILPTTSTEIMVIKVRPVTKPNMAQKCGSTQAAWAELLNNIGGTAIITANSRNDKIKVCSFNF